MKLVKIYVLIDPRDNTYKYVGKTKNDLSKRLRGHIRSSLKYCKTKKEYWIKSLLGAGLKPQIHLLEECTIDNWEDREIYWIKYYSKIYNLTNGTEGGDGVRDAKGEKNSMYGKKHTDYSKKLMGLKAQKRIGIKNSMSKKLYQYDIDGNFLKEWDYCKEAIDFYKISRGNVSNAAIHNLKYIESGYTGVIKTVHGFIFLHKKIEKIEYIKFHHNTLRRLNKNEMK
jgi:hypothetical protein